jgi:hypothetical protein
MTPRDPDPHTRYGIPLTAHAYAPTRSAIAAYIAYRDDQVMEPAPTPNQVRLVAQYCQEYINAPAFAYYVSPEHFRLRREVEQIRTVRELADWLWDCRRIGIEPL